jgi:hypothetical protein
MVRKHKRICGNRLSFQIKITYRFSQERKVHHGNPSKKRHIEIPIRRRAGENPDKKFIADRRLL